MTEFGVMLIVYFLVVVVLPVVVSCVIANTVGRGRGWAWGLLGPVGWLIAAMAANRRDARWRARHVASRARRLHRRSAAR